MTSSDPLASNTQLLPPAIAPAPETTAGGQASPALTAPLDTLPNPVGLRQDVLASILPWVAAPVGMAGLAGYWGAVQQNAHYTEQQLQEQMVSVSRALRDRLKDVRQIPKLVVSDPAVIEFSNKPIQPDLKLSPTSSDPPPSPLMLGKLRESLKQTAQVSQFLELAVFDRDGNLSASNQDVSLANQRHTSWWKRLQETGQHTNLVYNAAGIAAGIDISQVITNPIDNQFLGSVKGRISVDYMNQILSAFAAATLTTSEQIQILALDNGAINPVGTLSAGGIQKTKDILGGAAIAQRATALLEQQQTNTLQSGTQRIEYGEGDRGLVSQITHNGKQFLLATIPKSTWVTVVSVDQQEIRMNPSAWAWGLAATVLTLIGLAAIGSLNYARRLARTLTELTSAMETAARGNLAVQVTPQGSSQLQTLACGFNALMTHVKTSQQTHLEEIKLTQLTHAHLIQQQQETTQRAHQLNAITLKIRQSLRWEEVLKTTVRELRQALTSDRVVLYQFNPDLTASIIAESVAEPWRKILGELVTEPVEASLLDHYRNGYVQTIHDMDAIDAENLTKYHKELLEKFEIRAAMIAPILNSHQLMGLLCIHHCSGSRPWTPSDMNLLSQIAIQISYAFDQANLIQQQRVATRYADQLNQITFRIHNPCDRQQILEAVVQDVREVMGCDRVFVYQFEPHWYGKSLVASIAKDLSGKLTADLQNLSFTPEQIEQFKRGYLQTIDNLREAPLNVKDLAQLVSYTVKASLAAPIVTENTLVGLLIAHQCFQQRSWHTMETNFLRQIAMQLGFAFQQTAQSPMDGTTIIPKPVSPIEWVK
jgi:GAF domain-containing protein